MNKTTKMTLFIVLVSFYIAIMGLSIVFIDIPFGWVFVMAFIPVMIVLLLIAVNLTNGAIEQKTAQEIECPYCHKPNRLDHDFCAYCGKGLRPQITCEFCGAKNDIDQERCEVCDATLSKS